MGQETTEPQAHPNGDERLTFLDVRHVSDISNLDADVVVMGIPCATPYLHIPEYGRANLSGPRAIRRATSMFAQSHDRIDWDVADSMFSGSRDRVVDIGDLDVSFEKAAENRALIKSTTEAIVRQGAVPVVLGGEDSIPIPVVQGLAGLEDVTILQVDGHMDWRDEVNGERFGLSSGMRRASELPFVKSIVQVGMRGPSSGGPQEVADARAWGVKFFTGEEIHDHGVDPVIDSIREGANVHINFDLDSLDPSIMPAVWVPTPGGLSYWQASKLIRGVARKAKIVSFAMVELVEDRDITGTAAITASRLATTAIGEILRSRKG